MLPVIYIEGKSINIFNPGCSSTSFPGSSPSLPQRTLGTRLDVYLVLLFSYNYCILVCFLSISEDIMLCAYVCKKGCQLPVKQIST